MIKKSFLLIFCLCFALIACEQADMKKAIEYQNKGVYDKAVSNYLALIKKGKNVAEASKNLADIYIETEKYDAAFESYKKSLNITPEFALDEVINLTSNGKKQVRQKAITILHEVTNEETKKAIFEKLIQKIQSEEFYNKVDAIDAIFSFSKDASGLANDVLAVLDSEKAVIKQKILMNIYKIVNNDNYQTVVSKLEEIANNKEEDMLIRIAAVDGLTNIKSKTSLPKLIELTKENSAISSSAKGAIEKIGLPSKEQIPKFIPFLYEEQDAQTKLMVLKIFSDMKANANVAVPNIILLFKDKNKDVREAAKDALANIGLADPKVVNELGALLDNKDVDIKLRALNEIVEMNAVSQVIDKVKQLQEDPNKEVRKYAQQIVDNLK